MSAPDILGRSGRISPEMRPILDDRNLVIGRAVTRIEQLYGGKAQPVANSMAKVALADQTETSVQQLTVAGADSDAAALVRALAISAEVTKSKLL